MRISKTYPIEGKKKKTNQQKIIKLCKIKKSNLTCGTPGTEYLS